MPGCLYVVFSKSYFDILIIFLHVYIYLLPTSFFLQTWDGPTRRQRRKPIARQRCAAEAENRARVFLLPAPGAQSIFSGSCCPHSRVQPAENASFYLSLFFFALATTILRGDHNQTERNFWKPQSAALEPFPSRDKPPRNRRSQLSFQFAICIFPSF